MTALAFTIGEEDPNGSEPTETQVKAKAAGDAIDLAMEASAELEDEEEALVMSQDAEDETFLANPWPFEMVEGATDELESHHQTFHHAENQVKETPNSKCQGTMSKSKLQQILQGLDEMQRNGYCSRSQ